MTRAVVLASPVHGTVALPSSCPTTPTTAITNSSSSLITFRPLQLRLRATCHATTSPSRRAWPPGRRRLHQVRPRRLLSFRRSGPLPNPCRPFHHLTTSTAMAHLDTQKTQLQESVSDPEISIQFTIYQHLLVTANPVLGRKAEHTELATNPEAAADVSKICPVAFLKPQTVLRYPPRPEHTRKEPPKDEEADR